jgi:AraC-like DNA-binding protein
VRTVFKLDDVPVGGRFSLYRDVVESFYIPIGVSCESPQTFNAWVDGNDIGDISIGTCFLSAQSVSRKPEHIRRSEDDRLKLIMPLSGAIFSEQGPNRSLTGPGGFYLTDPTGPYEERIVDDMTFVYVLLPRSYFTGRMRSIEKVTASSFACQSPCALLAANYISGLSKISNNIEGQGAERLGAIALDLISMALWERAGSIGTNATAHRSTLFQWARSFIELQLHDSNLSLGVVAAAMGVSTRYISDVLSEGGVSFERYVLRERLTRCARRLGDPTFARHTIERVARENGFQNAAHFSRSFKQAYGMPPRDYRNIRCKQVC